MNGNGRMYRIPLSSAMLYLLLTKLVVLQPYILAVDVCVDSLNTSVDTLDVGANYFATHDSEQDQLGLKQTFI